MLPPDEAPREPAPPGGRSSVRRDVAAGVAALLAGLVLFGTGWFLKPEMPKGPYYVEVGGTPRSAVPYDGRMLVAAVGRIPVAQGPMANTAAASGIVERGGPLLVGLIRGQPTTGPVALLAFYAPDGNVAAMLGIDGDDVFFRERLRAARFNLHAPDYRLPGALEGIAPGDTLRLVTAAQRKGRCIQVERDSDCTLGHTPGSGWALLLGDDTLARGREPAANAVWLGLLLLPAGLLARPRTAVVLLVVVAWYAMVRLPADTVLFPAPWTEVAGAAAGLVLGGLLRWRPRRRNAPAPAPDPAPV